MRKLALNLRIVTWRETSSDFRPESHFLEEPPAATDVQGTWIISISITSITILSFQAHTFMKDILKTISQKVLHIT